MTDVAQDIGLTDRSVHIAGFWRRLLAFFVDSLILGVVGFCLGLLFHDYFVGLGAWGRAIGFVIASGYFSLMNSGLFGGQTVGKRLMKIKVMDGDGKALSIGNSMLRAGVFCLPYFLNGAQLGHIDLQLWFAIVLSLLVFGVGISTIYLVVFNRKTRQAPHDLIVGSYVARIPREPVAPTADSMWRGHYAVIAIIMFVSVAAPIYMWQLASTEPFASLVPLYKLLASEPQIEYATVTVGTNWSITSAKGKQSQSYVSARVAILDRNADFDTMANRIAGIILNNYPNAARRDVVAVSISYGYDIGIASAWQTKNYVFSPTEWRQRFQPRLHMRLETNLRPHAQSVRAAPARISDCVGNAPATT
jgi:uncharacterized RDD family membrane protein YckC